MSVANNTPKTGSAQTPAVAAEARVSAVAGLGKVIQGNIRDYGMWIALAVIMAIFTYTTQGTFISSRNISNLLNQTGYIGVLAVGMTLVIIIRHIDLSVGFLAGFIGAIAAILLSSWGWPVWAVIPIALAIGVLAGLLTGFLVAQVGIPAFVATLAGWLAYRGALQYITAGSGTVIVNDEAFNAIGNGFIPDILPAGSAILPGVHKLTLILGLVAIVLYVIGQLNNRRQKRTYNFEVLSTNLFVFQLIFVSVLIAAVTWVLAGYNGLSWTLVVVLVVVGIYHFITMQTVIGRHIYALGGNPEAAQLSGVNVKRLTYMVFASMGLLTALAGILFTSRLRSATPQAGQLFELDAIAAAFIGGVSPAGGIGKVMNSLIGALVYMSLTNGMNLMGTDQSLQYIIRGLVLALAVIFDVVTRNRAK